MKVLKRGSGTKTVVLLHGRGGTAEDIMSLADYFTGDFRFVAPEAETRAWYPNSFMSDIEKNEPDLSHSIVEIYKLIEPLPKEKVYLIGFSQGACLSLEIAARYGGKYGGIVALTGGLIGSYIDKSIFKGDLQGTKILITNGDQDPYIPLARSEESKRVLEERGAAVTLEVYQGRPHIVSKEEIALVNHTIL